MHRALAKRTRAHDDRTLVILQGACHDFGRGSRTAVDQHHHRDILHTRRQVLQIIRLHRTQVVLAVRRQPHLGVLGTPFRIDHQAVRFDEGRRNGNRAVEQTARVVAKIENQALERPLVFLVQRVERIDEQLAGMLLELGDAQVAVTAFQQFGFHAADLDHCARQRNDDGLIDALAHDGELDRRARLAAHALDRVVERHALDRCLVELDDEIARFDARLESRGVLDGRHNLHEAVFHADLDPEPPEFALGADLEVLETLGVEVGRMRIQPRQHAIDRFGNEFLVVYRLDVIALDAGEHIGERTQLLDWQRRFRIPIGHS